MENTLAFIQTCLSRFVKFGSRVVEGGALAALRAMDTMIEHFEYMEGGLPLFFVWQNWPAHHPRSAQTWCNSKLTSTDTEWQFN